MNAEDGLRAIIREQAEELEEWRSGRRELEAAALDAEELGRAIGYFKLTRSQARVIVLMAKRPGRLITRELLLNSITRGRHDKLADYHLSYARKALILAGIHHPFINVHGLGWIMDKEAAAKVLAAINPNGA